MNAKCKMQNAKVRREKGAIRKHGNKQGERMKFKIEDGKTSLDS
jgi:hypothetical protein